MALLPVIKYGHPTLRKRAKHCQAGEVTPTFIADLIQTMYAEDGVGLAATQVNVDKQVLVARDLDKNDLYVLIDPQIIAQSEKRVVEVEGCLSLPQLQAEVPRALKIEVRAVDPDGQPIHIKAKDHFARVLQHEIDHLNGILYIDRADLTTLVWLETRKDRSGEEGIERLPISLQEVQKRYIARYHKDLDSIVFHPDQRTGFVSAAHDA